MNDDRAVPSTIEDAAARLEEATKLISQAEMLLKRAVKLIDDTDGRLRAVAPTEDRVD